MTELMQYEQPDNGNNYLMPVTNTSGALARYRAMEDFVAQILKENTDYGIIPGTGAKKTLLKPGAEKLCALFGLAITYEMIEQEKDWSGKEHDDEPFFYFHYRVRLMRGHIVAGEGEGSCNSWEKKYRYRSAEKVCPVCKKATIIKGKSEFGGGWLCYAKKGGCGAKFKDGDQAIEGQATGQVVNADIADQVNTIQKMAQKRALVAATLNTVNASDWFTQDMEDYIDANFEVVPPPPAMPAQKAQRRTAEPEPVEPEFAEPVEPEATPAPEKPKTARPYSPGQLKQNLAKMATKSNAASTDEYNLVAAVISQWCDGAEDLRHKVQAFLFGSDSIKGAEPKMISAALAWLKPVYDNTEKKYLLAEHASEELSKVHNLVSD